MPISVIAFVLTIIIMSFVFGGLTIKWHNDFKLKRDRQRSELSGSSMGTGELKVLIQEAMAETVAPIEERLELIERNMRQLPEHGAEEGVPESREGS